MKATTHFGALDDLALLDPTIDIDRSARFYDHGQVIVSEGVSAGMDMSFYILSKYFGEDISNEVKRYIEY